MIEDDRNLSDDARRALMNAGWSDGRNMAEQVDEWSRQLAPGFLMFPVARSALSRFGTVQVQQTGPGEECARESFEFDPMLALGEDDRFRQFEERLSTRLYPLGEAGGGHVFLAISETGHVFALMDELWLVAPTIEGAIEALVRGLQLRKVS